MTDFRFIHAADIHLDSPLRGLSRYEGMPVDDIRGATRAAFDNLIRLALDEAVDFLVIAGDLFDGDWKDMGTGLYFARAMGQLDVAGIPVFLLAGNHDAGSVLTKSVPWPSNVRRFGTRSPETFIFEALGVAIHGQSFANAAVTDNLASAYPPAKPHHFNIGVLHTCLSGHPGHERYAPCSLDDLHARGYDYWALGHVHDYTLIKSEGAPIVFPGNIQGRNIRETGPKGVVLVEVSDRQIATITAIELDVLRWARAEADCTGADDVDAVRSRMREALVAAHSAGAGRPVIARVELTGETSLAGLLADQREQLRNDARAIAAAISPDLWLEKLSLDVRLPAPTSPSEMADNFLAILAEAPDSPDLAKLIAEDLAPFLTATAAVAGADDGALRDAVSNEDWACLLDEASKALGARLTAAGNC